MPGNPLIWFWSLSGVHRAEICGDDLVGASAVRFLTFAVRRHEHTNPKRLCLTIVLSPYLTREHTPHPAFGRLSPRSEGRGHREGCGGSSTVLCSHQL